MVTKDTRKSCGAGCCRKKTIHHSVWKANHHQLWFFLANKRIWNKIDNILERDFPACFKRIHRIRVPRRFFCKSYPTMAVNLNFPSEPHNDPNDIEYSCVAPFGSYQGGDLVFPQLKVQLQLAPGDIVFFQAHRYTHFNRTYIGRRNSLVLFCHRTMEKRRSFVENRAPNKNSVL